MRKLLIIFFTMTLMPRSGFAQHEVDFDLQLSPEMKYDQTVIEQSDVHMTYSGPKEMMAQLKGKNVSALTDQHHVSDIESLTETGKMSGGSTFPVRMEFVKMTTDGQPSVIPAGSVIYGHTSVGQMPALDSLSAPGMNDTLKKSMMQMMQALFSQLSYPHQKVKIGEKFTRESTISIPVAGMSIDFLITTHYRLTKVHDGVAQFDVTQDYTMQTRQDLLSSMAIKASGKVKGHMDYDIAHQFYQAYQLSSTLDMDMSIKQLRFKLQSKSNYDQHAKITAM